VRALGLRTHAEDLVRDEPKIPDRQLAASPGAFLGAERIEF
jgi:hypothetical protein